MLVDKIILRTGSKFTSYIAEWAKSNCDELLMLSDRHLDLVSMESLLIFNQNQHLTRDIIEYKSVFDKLQKPIHNIDINGTLSVGKNNLELWISVNKCKTILIVGADDLTNNVNLNRFLESIQST
jgi:hypothetical protein